MVAAARTTPAAETHDELEARAHETIAEGYALLARARRMRALPATATWLTLPMAAAIACVRPAVIGDARRRGEIRSPTPGDLRG